MNCDYEVFRADLEKMDRDLRAGAVENLAIELALENLPQTSGNRAKNRCVRFAPMALRMELLRHLLGLPSFRKFSQALASSDLLADFCNVRTITGIRWTSKSTLDRASKLWKPHQLEAINRLLVEVAANPQFSSQLDLEQAVDSSVCLVDSTCLEANIHFPVDWVLLKDVATTLLKGLVLIRKRGLKRRMPNPPRELIRIMNRLCIKMTHSRRRKNSRKYRKQVLREMKHLLKAIGGHAQRHLKLLNLHWDQTDLSEKQTARIQERMECKLKQLPRVVQQAHERIIGERQVKSADKILSVHEDNLHVMVRGKASGEVEFGNNLFLCESPDGFILDYHLYQERAPVDAKQLKESLDRQQGWDIDASIEKVVADRGFDTRTIARELKENGIDNHICPRNAQELTRRLKEPDFRILQKRRGGTEARIAILKNNGGGRVCRAKGFGHRAMAVGWGVLAHNLWWVARKVRENQRCLDKAA